MNSPYMGKFYVSQGFRPAANPSHDGIDLVGQDSKEVHSTVSGKVHFAGWENAGNHRQGFGQYVCVLGNDGLYYYFGHLSEIRVKIGATVKCTDVLGIEGSTGYSTGSHCHYEIRKAFYKGAEVINVCTKSGIPNACGTYDDGFRIIKASAEQTGTEHIKELQRILNNKGYRLTVDGIAGAKTLEACHKFTIENGDSGELTKWVQERLKKLGFFNATPNGTAEASTMKAIGAFKEKYGLSGTDWDILIK